MIEGFWKIGFSINGGSPIAGWKPPNSLVHWLKNWDSMGFHEICFYLCRLVIAWRLYVSRVIGDYELNHIRETYQQASILWDGTGVLLMAQVWGQWQLYQKWSAPFPYPLNFLWHSSFKLLGNVKSNFFRVTWMCTPVNRWLIGITQPSHI